MWSAYLPSWLLLHPCTVIRCTLMLSTCLAEELPSSSQNKASFGWDLKSDSMHGICLFAAEAWHDLSPKVPEYSC